MNASMSRFLAHCAIACCLFPAAALANHDVTNVTVTGGTPLIVAPGGNVPINVTVEWTGNQTWAATAYAFANAQPAMTVPPYICDSDPTPDVSQNGFNGTRSFNVTAPVTPGTYNLYVSASSNSTCNGAHVFQAGNNFTVANAITVQAPAVCGNNVVETGEACDDGNTSNGDCCSSTCQFEANGAACGGSSAACDALDTCDGAGVCVDNVDPPGTVCRAAADQCDVAETCDGASAACPADGFQVDGTSCDDSDACTQTDECFSGVCVGSNPVVCSAAGECFDVGVCDSATGVCSDPPKTAGAACGDGSDTECTDPDTCDGAGACQDNHAAAATACGDAGTECTNQDTCDGSGACTDNGFVAADTACGDGSDTECTDPDTCDGAGACQDNHAAAATACGDAGTECTNQDTCDGSGACTDNGFVAEFTACGDGSDTECSNPDSCDGAGTCDPRDEASGFFCGDDGTECVVQDTCDGSGACTDNGFEPEFTACGDGSDTECSNPDSCDGAGTCDPRDEAAGFFCGDDGTECIVQDTCDGSGTCDDNGFEPEGTACGDGSMTECTDPDTCDGAGTCEFNNVACGSVTSSALCEFDEEPDKGTCDGGDFDGAACSVNNPGDCEAGGGTCEQTDQFRVAFSPDMQNWVSYKQNSTNPGQFYYNAIYQMDDFGDFLVMDIPYPFVTQGATPVHVYDADSTPSNGEGCLAPEDAYYGVQFDITIEDWINGATRGNDDYFINCESVPDPSQGEDAFCTVGIWITDEAAGASDGFMYVNMHMDYGLKGPMVDADGDGFDDRYDRAGYISPWGSSDALFDTDDNTGDVAIADCSEHYFSHTNVSLTDANDDSVENLNVFKRAAGAFGRAYCGSDDSALTGWIQLQRADDDSVVYTTEIDEDGYYAAAYSHRGRAIDYQLQFCDDSDCTTPGAVSEPFPLQSNGFVEVNWEEDSACDGGSFAAISPIYSKGKFKNAP